MPKRLLSDQYDLDRSDSMTAMAGLSLYGGLFVAAGLLDGAREHLGLREQGWDDGTTLLSLVLLNIAGGDHVEDIEHLDADAALSEAMLQAKQTGMPRAQRRKIQREWRKQYKRGRSGDVMPCDRFGANAAWWAIMLLAYNLNTVMRCVVLGGSWRKRKLKALRFHFIRVAGRIVRHSGQIRIKVSAAAHALLAAARSRILELAQPAPA